MRGLTMLATAAMAVGVLAALPAARGQEAPALAEVCAACHGAAGVPTLREVPVIWGQNEGYLYLQLRDMKKGARVVPAMEAVVAMLEKPDMQALAAYFAAQPWPDLRQPGASDDETRRAQQANTSVGCTGCHAASFRASGSVPRLAGQQGVYLAKTMTDFRTNARANNPGMTDLMNATNPADLPAIAGYLSAFSGE